MYRKSHDTHMNHACIVLVYIVPSYGFSQMDLNDESSEEEDEPVTAAPAPHPQHAAAEPTPQPVEEPEDARCTPCLGKSDNKHLEKFCPGSPFEPSFSPRRGLLLCSTIR